MRWSGCSSRRSRRGWSKSFQEAHGCALPTRSCARRSTKDSISLRRRSWHRTIADLLASRPQPDPDVIATHYQQAADSQAVPWLIRAGERAQLAYAWSTAVERYEAALALLHASDGDPNERGWLQYRIARLERFRNPRAGIAYLDDVLRLTETEDLALAAAARFSRGVCALHRWRSCRWHCTIWRWRRSARSLAAAGASSDWTSARHRGLPTITNPRGWLVATLALTAIWHEAVRMGEATREGLPRLTPLGEIGSSHYGDRYIGSGCGLCAAGTCRRGVGRIWAGESDVSEQRPLRDTRSRGDTPRSGWSRCPTAQSNWTTGACSSARTRTRGRGTMVQRTWQAAGSARTRLPAAGTVGDAARADASQS